MLDSHHQRLDKESACINKKEKGEGRGEQVIRLSLRSVFSSQLWQKEISAEGRLLSEKSQEELKKR